MVDIIMNEREWCENALENFHTGNTYEAIARLARYYYSLGYKRSDVISKLENYLTRYDDNVSLVKWQDSIERCVDNMDKRPLVNIPFIPVTRKEMGVIAGRSNVTEQKTLFSLLCLTKYLNAVDGRNHDWCRFEPKDIFSLANLQLNVRRRGLLLAKLRTDGLVTFSRIVDNTNMHAEFVDHDGEPEIKIFDFRNLGFQYMAIQHDGYMRCSVCGVTIRRRSPAQKYCPVCAVAVDHANRTARRRAAEALQHGDS